MLSFSQERMLLPIASFGKSGELASNAARMLNNPARNLKPFPKKRFISKVSGKLSLECNTTEDDAMLPPRTNRSPEGDKQEPASIDETTVHEPNFTSEAPHQLLNDNIGFDRQTRSFTSTTWAWTRTRRETTLRFCRRFNYCLRFRLTRVAPSHS